MLNVDGKLMPLYPATGSHQVNVIRVTLLLSDLLPREIRDQTTQSS